MSKAEDIKAKSTMVRIYREDAKQLKIIGATLNMGQQETIRHILGHYLNSQGK